MLRQLIWDVLIFWSVRGNKFNKKNHIKTLQNQQGNRFSVHFVNVLTRGLCASEADEVFSKTPTTKRCVIAANIWALSPTTQPMGKTGVSTLKPVQRWSPHLHCNDTVCMPNTFPGSALMWRSRRAERAPTKVMKITRLMSEAPRWSSFSLLHQWLLRRFFSSIFFFFRRFSVDARSETSSGEIKGSTRGKMPEMAETWPLNLNGWDGSNFCCLFHQQFRSLFHP